MKKLTLKDQGNLCYTISALNQPRLHVKPGEVIAIETQDAFSGQIRNSNDRRDLIKMPYTNPQSGPIFIDGAQPGDTLAVHVRDIQPLTGQGATRLVSHWYSDRADSDSLLKLLNLELPHGTRICKIENQTVHVGTFSLRYKPMLGTIATASPMETVLTNFPGPNGGNMDITEVTIGATLYLPVSVEGGLLHLGDAHAVQGEGELSGAAVEMPSLTTIKVDLIKQHPIAWPRIENKHDIFVITATQPGRTLEDAIRLAFLELTFWIEEEYSIKRWTAYELLTMAAKVRLGNFWTVAVGLPKEYLVKAKIHE